MTLQASRRRSLSTDRRFRSFWAGQTISAFGDQVTNLALPLIAVSLGASVAQVAWLTALVWLPSLLAILLGAWIDRRRRKRRLMVVADLVRAVVLLSLPAVALLGGVTLPQLYAVALATGAAGVLFSTAYPAFFAHLVAPEEYLAANSRLSSTLSAAYVGGPALGGLLVQVFSAPVAVAADALSFLASAFLVQRVGLDEPQPEPAAGSVLRGAREGLAFVVRHPVLRASLGCAATINFFTFVAGSGLMVLFATRDLHLSPGVIGLAYGIGATGALLGAVLAPRVTRRLGLGRTIVLGAVLFTAPIALVALAAGPTSQRAATLATAELLCGTGVMLFDVPLNSLKTSIVPDGMRSRVAGAFSSVNYGVRPLGAVVGGVLGTAVGLRPTLLVAAAGGVASVVFLLLSPVPRIRTLAG